MGQAGGEGAVKVDIPEEVGWALMERAFTLGVPVEEVVGAALGGVGPTQARHAADEHIWTAVGRLVDEGHCDAAIAEMTHYTVGYIAATRRRLGKPANRRYPSRE